MVREKYQHAPVLRDRTLARPEQRTMLDHNTSEKSPVRNKGAHGEHKLYLRVVEDEVREQDKVEFGTRQRQRFEERLDGTAPHVPEHRDHCDHVVLCDIMRHIIHERTIWVVRQHHLRPIVSSRGSVSGGGGGGENARSARRSWRRRARVGLRLRRARAR